MGGYGGPCSPRDNVALNFVGKHLGVSTRLLEVNDDFNRSISPRFVEKLKPCLREGTTAAVLGLAYKPLSHVIEESAGIYLCRALADAGLRVIGYDPLATQEACIALRDHALVTDFASCPAYPSRKCLPRQGTVSIGQVARLFCATDNRGFRPMPAPDSGACWAA